MLFYMQIFCICSCWYSIIVLCWVSLLQSSLKTCLALVALVIWQQINGINREREEQVLLINFDQTGKKPSRSMINLFWQKQLVEIVLKNEEWIALPNTQPATVCHQFNTGHVLCEMKRNGYNLQPCCINQDTSF